MAAVLLMGNLYLILAYPINRFLRLLLPAIWRVSLFYYVSVTLQYDWGFSLYNVTRLAIPL
jgi:hypothetical protein